MLVLDLEMMIIEDNNFQVMVEEINECIGEAFERAEEYSEIFEARVSVLPFVIESNFASVHSPLPLYLLPTAVQGHVCGRAYFSCSNEAK